MREREVFSMIMSAGASFEEIGMVFSYRLTLRRLYYSDMAPRHDELADTAAEPFIRHDDEYKMHRTPTRRIISGDIFI